MSADEEDVKPKLNITVVFEGQSCAMKVRPTADFKKVFAAAEKRFQKEPKTLKFTLRGQRIQATDIIGSLELDEDDVIDANLEQVGGGVRPVF